MLKPHPAGITAFDGGELRKSFMAHGLNKTRILSGGGSGYRSESRNPITEEGKYRIQGFIYPAKCTKTIVHYKSGGKNHSISKKEFIPHLQAFKLAPFTYKVEYADQWGIVMTVTNTNIR